MKQPNLFSLTPDLYSYYLRALLVGSYLDYRDRAKAHAVSAVIGEKRALHDIYRYIGLKRFYESLGANSARRKQACLRALELFYERKTRGSDQSQKVSMWVNRGEFKELTRAAVRVLTHYQLLNEEILMQHEKNLYDAKTPMVPVRLEFETLISKAELHELIELVKDIEAEEAALRAKKPRKPRTPDTEETKAKKRAAALERHERKRLEAEAAQAAGEVKP